MPEGHTIHNIAKRHRTHFVGGRILTASPQGRFAEGAALLNNKTLAAVDAHGKHLFYRWKNAPVLYVHLGLVGKFFTFESAAPDPSPATRLVFARGTARAYLTGPMSCEILDPEEAAEIRGRLGPDPLQSRTRGKKDFVAGLLRRSVPVAAALLDQKLLAGVGNVYRSEVLFLDGIHPLTPSNELSEDQSLALWDTISDQLRIGLKYDKIITVTKSDADPDLGDRVYAYKRDGEPCLRCHTPIRTVKQAQRSVWWCPTCQPKLRRRSTRKSSP